jgi:hypothetical protein
MENSQPKRPFQFLIRLWTEDLGGGELEWRGKAQNIATGNSSYFRDWPGLVAAIQKLLEPDRVEQEQPRTEP